MHAATKLTIFKGLGKKREKLQAQVVKTGSPKWQVWNLPKSATLNALGTVQ